MRSIEQIHEGKATIVDVVGEEYTYLRLQIFGVKIWYQATDTGFDCLLQSSDASELEGQYQLHEEWKQNEKY